MNDQPVKLPVALSATLQAWLNDPQFREVWEGFCGELEAMTDSVRRGETPDAKRIQDAIEDVLDTAAERADNLPVFRQQ